MCFLCRRSDPAWRSFARTLRLAFPRALVPQLPWRDFRNQLNKKKRHSINSFPAVLSSPGLLNGSSPKHLSRVWLFVLPHLNDGDTGVALNRRLRSVKRVWGPLLLLLWKLRVRSPDAWGLRPMRTPPPPPDVVRSTPLLRCPSPFGVLRGQFCQPCHLLCFRAQQSAACAFLKVHPETLWLWDACTLRGGFQNRQFRLFLSVLRFRMFFGLHN